MTVLIPLVASKYSSYDYGGSPDQSRGLRYGLRNAWVPSITGFGSRLPALVGGLHAFREINDSLVFPAADAEVDGTVIELNNFALPCSGPCPTIQKANQTFTLWFKFYLFDINDDMWFGQRKANPNQVVVLTTSGFMVWRIDSFQAFTSLAELDDDTPGWRTAGLTWTAGGPGPIGCYYNGRVVTTDTRTSRLRVNEQFHVGGAEYQNAGTYSTGRISHAYVYDRALTASEHKALHDDPFAPVRADVEYIPVITGGGTPDPVLTADAGSFTVTGSTASLEIGYLIAADSGSYDVTGSTASLEIGYLVAADSGSYVLTGSDATLIFGHLLTANSGTITLTGTDASLEKGFYIEANSGSFTLSAGTEVIFDVTVAVDPGSFTVSGTDAGLVTTRLLTADPGSFTLSGTDASLEKGFYLGADSGSLTLTGTDADLYQGFGFAADSGSFTLSGTAASLLVARIITADNGTFTLTGTEATLTGPEETLTADSGSFSLSGTDATLTVGRVITAESGGITVTGTDAGVLADRVLTCDSGSVTLTGTDAGTLAGRYLGADSGSFTLTGTDASLLADRYLSVNPGSFTITGTAATLTALTSGAINQYVLISSVLGVVASSSMIGVVASSSMTGKP